MGTVTKTPEAAKVQCAAVCVYPLRIEDASKALRELDVDKSVKIASGMLKNVF